MTAGNFVMVVLLSLVAPVVQSQPGPVFKQENTPANLQALMQHVFQKIYVDKSLQEGAALLRTLIPSEARVRRGLREGLAPDLLAKVFAFHKGLASAGDDDPSKLAQPGQTVVRVSGATTEALRKYENGSVAFNVFPGGARQAAEQILRPGLTFYEVEFLEPGKTLGIKYHLVFWDGQQWTMLGPIWRVLS